MKRMTLLLALMAMLFSVTSCKPEPEPDPTPSAQSLLVGMWGVELIEYYNIDYAGQPISNTIEQYEYTPGDFDNGIEIIFDSNHQGEFRDHDIDTIFEQISINPVEYDTIINPDTTVVTRFTYTYDQEIPAVFVSTENARTFMLKVEQLDETTFSYINNYDENIVEHAVMKRLELDNAQRRPVSGKKVGMPRRPGSIFSHESLDK